MRWDMGRKQQKARYSGSYEMKKCHPGYVATKNKCVRGPGMQKAANISAISRKILFIYLLNFDIKDPSDDG
jgi:hypothetical protein